LAGSTWEADANILRISDLSLVYYTAEYCSPKWLNSTHTDKIDKQLNITMRTIGGLTKSTPLKWLPVISNIPPPRLRRENNLLRECNKYTSNPNLPIHKDLSIPGEIQRLTSQKPPWRTARKLIQEKFDINNRLVKDWISENPDLHKLVRHLTAKQLGFLITNFYLTKIWTTLNRIRTGHGKSGHMMFKWRLCNSEVCDCGHKSQVTHIMSYKIYIYIYQLLSTV